jgi:tetratricopeptide (TPR) repeat protein
VTALLLLAATSAAQAQPAPGKPYDKERARALYDEGLRHYNVAEYDQAIESFKSSYLVSGDASLLFNIAQAYRLSGNCEQALRFYKNFQRENPGASNAGEVDAAISKCEAAPPPPPAPEPRAAEPAPEPPVAVPVDIAPSAPAPLRPIPGAAPPPGTLPAVSPAEPRRDRGARRRLLGAVTAGAGAALLVSGLYFGIKAMSQASDTADQKGEWGPEQQRAEEAGQRNGRIGGVLTGLGAAAVVTGGVVYLLGSLERPGPVAVALAPAGAKVVWRCAF